MIPGLTVRRELYPQPLNREEKALIALISLVALTTLTTGAQVVLAPAVSRELEILKLLFGAGTAATLTFLFYRAIQSDFDEARRFLASKK